MLLPDDRRWFVVSVAFSAVAFLCPLLGAWIGISLRRRLPEHHLSHDATDVIKLAMGLMVTLVALTLGLLITSANTYHAMIDAEDKQTLAGIVHLDEYLRAYGPETAAIRERVRHIAARAFEDRWPGEDFGSADLPNDGNRRFTDAQRMMLELQPHDPAQKWFQAQALQVTEQLSNLRSLVQSQETATAPLLPVFILIFLSTIAIFGSFSLYVPPNATLTTVLCLAALAIAGASFLIIELNSPFDGLLRISSQGAHAVVAMLGQPR
jgi:hypothetical protein